MTTRTPRPRRSTSLIEAGDTFVFNGLVGGPSETPLPDGSDRLITVIGVSVTGNLQITIEWVEPDAAREPTIHDVPYDLALQMIAAQIWQACEQP